MALEPGDHLGAVGRVLCAEAGREADFAGVGLRVLAEVGDDRGGRRGDGLDEAEGLGGAFAGVGVADLVDGGCAGEVEFTADVGDGHEVDGGGGRGDKGEEEDGVGVHLEVLLVVG